MKNLLVVGLGDQAELLDTKPGFLLIDDGTLAAEFLTRFPTAAIFDATIHSFNPLKRIDYKGARAFAETVYGGEGKDTLTVRNGKRALTRLLLTTKPSKREGALRLDHFKREPSTFRARANPEPADGEGEAIGTIEDLLLSPVLRRVLCQPTNFSFRAGRSIIAHIDRAELGEYDAFILGSLLIRQFAGQIIIPDFGFYARPFHSSLIREGRLMAGVHTLAELEPKMRQMCLLMEKVGHRCTYEDAETLAKYAGMVPTTNEYKAAVQEAME